MFVIYVNELIGVLERLNITVKLFADDVKLYVRILDDLDIQRLQSAVVALCRWADNWQLSVSVNKCCVLNVGKSGFKTDIYINGDCLPEGESVRDLGVFVAKDLSPQVQVNNVVSRAHKRAAAILRAFVSRDVNLLMRAFPCQTHCGVQHYNLVTVDCA